ncbi:MAG: MFS transporter [Bryobacterales bacterium]|nr:MFS transporter [Bryobacterales bacterium]
MARSPILPIFLIVLVDILGLTMLIPLLPFYAVSFGASARAAGGLMAVYALFSLLSGPPLGALSDRFGRKPVLLASQLGTLLGLILMAFAQSLWVVFVARVIDGITAGNISVAQAYIADVSKPSERAKSFGLIGIAFGLGFLIGPAATAFLASRYGDRAAVLGAAALSALSILATLVLLPAHPPKPEGADETPAGGADAASYRRPSVFDLNVYAAYFRRPAIAPFLWQFLIAQLAFSVFMGGYALFAKQRFGMDTAGVSVTLTYAGLLGIVVQGVLLPRLLRSAGEMKLLLTGFAATVLSTSTLAFASTTTGIYVSITALALTGFLRPVLSSLISRRSSPQEQGAVLGLTQSLSAITQILGPLLAGEMIDRHLLTAWGLTGAAIGACGLLLLFFSARRGGPAAMDPPPAAAAR